MRPGTGGQTAVKNGIFSIRPYPKVVSLPAAFLRACLVTVTCAVSGFISISVDAQVAETACRNVPSSLTKIHVVKRGETLGEILVKAGFRRLWCASCAVAETAKQNGLDDANRLQIGQTITLHKTTAALAGCEPSAARETASMTASETLSSSINEKHAVSEAAAAITPTAPTPVAPLPPAEVAVVERRPFQSELFFGIPLHVVEVTGTDRIDRTSGRLLTGINPGAVFAWRLRADSGWGAEISSRFENDAIQADVNSINIDGREQKIGSVEAHASYGSQIRFGLDFRSRDRLIYRAATGRGIRVQTLPTRNFGATIGASLVQLSSLSVQGFASYETLLPDANFNQGSSYSGRLILRQDFERWALESEAGYETSRYQTILLEVVGSDLWLTWGISWKL